MTTITLATVHTLPPRETPMPIRWQPAVLGAPTTRTRGTAGALEAIERAHATMVVVRVLVVSLLGTAAMLAGAVIGRL